MTTVSQYESELQEMVEGVEESGLELQRLHSKSLFNMALNAFSGGVCLWGALFSGSLIFLPLLGGFAIGNLYFARMHYLSLKEDYRFQLEVNLQTMKVANGVAVQRDRAVELLESFTTKPDEGDSESWKRH